MSDDLRAAAEFEFFFGDLDPSGKAILALALPLVKLERESVATALMNLANEPADPETGLELPSDEALSHLLRCIPADERTKWVLAMDQLVRNDDAPRFEGLMDLLRVRVAH